MCVRIHLLATSLSFHSKCCSCWEFTGCGFSLCAILIEKIQ